MVISQGTTGAKSCKSLTSLIDTAINHKAKEIIKHLPFEPI